MFVKAIIGFPKHIIDNVLSLVLAFFVDWETLVLFLGAGLVAYGTGAYLIVAGVILTIYALLRVFGQIAHERSMATGLLGRVIRDNPELLAGERAVAITQLPAVLLQTAQPPEEELEDVGT
jgi:hypothetical protein